MTHFTQSKANALLLCLVLLVTACGNSSPTTSLDSARERLSQQDPLGAVIILKGVVRDQPDNEPAQRLLGETYFKLGDYPAATRTLNDALALNSSDDQLFMLYAQSLIEQREYTRALDALAARQMLPENQVPAAALTALAEIGLGQLEAAAEILENSAAGDDPHYQVLYAKSALYAAKGDSYRSIQFAKQAIDAAPDNPILHNHLGRLLLGQQLYQQAANEFEASLLTSGESRVTAQNISIKLKILHSQLAGGDLEQAKLTLAELQAAAPDHPMTHYFGGLVAYEDQEFDKAEAEAEATLAQLPTYAPAKLLAGIASYKLEKYEVANMYLGQFLASQPGNLSASKTLAATLLHLERPDQAKKEIEKIANTHSGDEELQDIINSLEQNLSDSTPGAGANKSALNEMIQRLDTSVDRRPDNSVTQIRMLLSNGYYGEADQRISKLLKDSAATPDSPENRIYLNLAGASAALQNNPAQAEKRFRQALEIDPQALDTTLNLGMVLASTDQLDAAASLYKNLLATRPKATQLLLELAKLADRQQNKEQAIDFLNQAIAINPKNPGLWITLVNYYLRAGEYRQAEATAQQALQSLPDNPTIELLLAKAYAGLGEQDKAIASLTGLVQTFPDNGIYYLQLAQFQIAAEQPQAALENFRKAHGLLPKEYAAVGQRAALEFVQGNTAVALALAEDYTAMVPDDPRGYGLQANLMTKNGDPAGAAQAMAKAFNSAPTAAWTLRYVHALIRNKEFDQAFAIAEAWLKEHPQAHGFRYALGNLYLHQGQLDLATRHYMRLADQGEANSQALNNLAWALYQTDKPEALTYAEQAVAAAPNNPNAVDTLAWILIDSGRDSRRGTELLSGLKNVPNSIYPTVQYHLAVGLQQLGNRAQATDILTEIVTGDHQFADKNAAATLLNELKNQP